MLGFTPFRFYYYMWKYVTPILLLLLLCSSVIQLCVTPPSYNAWIQEEVSQHLSAPLPPQHKHSPRLSPPRDGAGISGGAGKKI